MWKPALIVTGVVLGLLIVAGLLWTPGYNRAGVHPTLLAIEEPLQSATAYFDETGHYLSATDARGVEFHIYLPPDHKGSTLGYPREFVSSNSYPALTGGIRHTCSNDSRKFLAQLIDGYVLDTLDRHECLRRLRNAPFDALRRWWLEKTFWFPA